LSLPSVCWPKVLPALYEVAGQRSLPVLIFATSIFLVSAHSQTNRSSTGFAAISKRAAEARDANRLEEATKLYRLALTLHSNWEDGWWSLGTLEYDQDRYAAAAMDFQRLIVLQPSNGTAHAMLGLCQFELGKAASALKNLLAAERFGIINNDQLRKVALYHLGVLQLRARKFGDAQRTLHQLAKEHVETNELITALGQAALLINPAGAIPDNATPVIQRVGEAEALSATKDFDRAKQIYTELVTQNPETPNLHFAYGRLLLETHDTDQAIAEFRRELDRDPTHVNSMLEIASVQYQLDSENSRKYAEEAVKLAPQIPFGHYLLGLLRLDTGDPAGAIPELEIARKAFPSHARVYYSLGNAYSRVGRKAEAAKARAEFTRLNKQEETQEAQQDLSFYRERALSDAQSGERHENPPQ
jgi:tetratricopeptide (TPR) repeat protein